jgi:hypothetical protein
MMMKRTDPNIHDLTAQEIARQVAPLSLRRVQIMNERAALYAHALKNGGGGETSVVDADERAAREHAKFLLNGHAPAMLSMPPDLTRDKILYREQRGIDIALKILSDKDLVARAAEAVEWGESHADEWRRVAREITLAAVRLDALERHARKLLAGCCDLSAVRLPMVMIANARSISDVPIIDLKAAALAENIVSNNEIKKAEHVD